MGLFDFLKKKEEINFEDILDNEFEFAKWNKSFMELCQIAVTNALNEFNYLLATKSIPLTVNEYNLDEFMGKIYNHNFLKVTKEEYESFKYLLACTLKVIDDNKPEFTSSCMSKILGDPYIKYLDNKYTYSEEKLSSQIMNAYNLYVSLYKN